MLIDLNLRRSQQALLLARDAAIEPDYIYDCDDEQKEACQRGNYGRPAASQFYFPDEIAHGSCLTVALDAGKRKTIRDHGSKVVWSAGRTGVNAYIFVGSVASVFIVLASP